VATVYNNHENALRMEAGWAVVPFPPMPSQSRLTCHSLTAGRTRSWQMPQDQRKEDRDGYQSNGLDGMAGIVGGED